MRLPCLGQPYDVNTHRFLLLTNSGRMFHMAWNVDDLRGRQDEVCVTALFERMRPRVVLTSAPS